MQFNLEKNIRIHTYISIYLYEHVNSTVGVDCWFERQIRQAAPGLVMEFRARGTAGFPANARESLEKPQTKGRSLRAERDMKESHRCIE